MKFILLDDNLINLEAIVQVCEPDRMTESCLLALVDTNGRWIRANFGSHEEALSVYNSICDLIEAVNVVKV